MNNPGSKSKSVIPKKVQIPLLVIGAVFLIITGVQFCSKMGWIGKPPTAKTEIVAKEPDTPPEDTPETMSVPVPITPRPEDDDRPALEDLQLGPRDPLSDFNLPEPEPADTTPSAGPDTSGAPPPLMDASLLPPPIPAGGLPNPFPGGGVTGEATPVAVTPQGPRLSEALATPYPMAHRGAITRGQPAPVSLVGTISGSKGSVAVVRRSDVEGSRGDYVRPGERVGSGDHRIEDIGPGRITVRGNGRTSNLTLPRGSGQTSTSTARPSGSIGHPVIEQDEPTDISAADSAIGTSTAPEDPTDGPVVIE